MSEVKRTALHKRQINVEGYSRDDGLWEVEGWLGDTKGYEMELMGRGKVPVGGYLHQMRFILVVNDQLEIVDARTAMLDTPYPDCKGAEPAYSALIGLTIRSGWIEDAKKALGRENGCTHLTELLPVMATAAIQTIRGYRMQREWETHQPRSISDKMVNSCYGFREGGQAYQVFWPKSDASE